MLLNNEKAVPKFHVNTIQFFFQIFQNLRRRVLLDFLNSVVQHLAVKLKFANFHENHLNSVTNTGILFPVQIGNLIPEKGVIFRLLGSLLPNTGIWIPVKVGSGVSFRYSVTRFGNPNSLAKLEFVC